MEDSNRSNYSDQVMCEYRKHLEDLKSSGAMCFGNYRFNIRICRMVESYVKTGKVDFSRAKMKTAYYPVPDELNQIVETILIENCTKTQIDDYRAPIRHLFWYINERSIKLQDVSDELILDFFINEVPKTNAGSIYRVRKCIKIVVEYLKKNGNNKLKRDYSLIKVKSRKNRIIPAFSNLDIKKMTEVIDTSSDVGKRDLAIILIGFSTGLRASDIANLKLTDIDWKKKQISIIQSKTQKAIICQLNGTTLNAIADYILNGRPESSAPEIFLSSKAPHSKIHRNFASIIDKYICAANVKDINGRGFHSLRRAFETELVSNGVSIEVASQMLGHSTINEDKPYLTYSKEQCSFIALDFENIPLRSKYYQDI